MGLCSKAADDAKIFQSGAFGSSSRIESEVVNRGGSFGEVPEPRFDQRSHPWRAGAEFT